MRSVGSWWRRSLGRVLLAGGAVLGLGQEAVAAGVVRRVPQQHASIQGAVDAATAGDLILIEPGIYRESIVIRTANIVLRGRDRARVIVEGAGGRGVGIDVAADGVALENLTVRGFREVGIRWSGVTGYRGRYLTLLDNAGQGVLLDQAVDGVVEEVYVRGAAEAGIAITRCGPCRALLRRVTAEWNGAGFAAQDASGDLLIVDGIWRHNRVGLLPHGRDTVPTVTGATTIIRGNVIHDNANARVPGRGRAVLALGNGVLISGGDGIHVLENVIASHVGHGIVIAPLPGDPWRTARRNVITSNVILAAGRAGISVGGPRTASTCIGPQRTHVTRAPAWLWCRDGAPGGIDGDLVPALLFRIRGSRTVPVGEAVTSAPEIPTLPTLARADRLPVVSAIGGFDSLHAIVDSVTLPAAADSVRQAVELVGMVPPETPRVGAFLGALQEWLPLTLPLLGLVLLLLGAWRGGIVWWRRRGHTGRKALRAWRVAVGLVVVWVGLAIGVAVSFAGTS